MAVDCCKLILLKRGQIIWLCMHMYVHCDSELIQEATNYSHKHQYGNNLNISFQVNIEVFRPTTILVIHGHYKY